MAINFNKAEFVLSAVKASTFIRDGKPQVTFAGRSNVGIHMHKGTIRAYNGDSGAVFEITLPAGR